MHRVRGTGDAGGLVRPVRCVVVRGGRYRRRVRVRRGVPPIFRIPRPSIPYYSPPVFHVEH
jgi:hypothetical protein